MSIFQTKTTTFIDYLQKQIVFSGYDKIFLPVYQMGYIMQNVILYELQSEKNGLQGFRHGPMQISLYSHRRLEA